MTSLQEKFEKNGYVVVKKALNKELCDFITQYSLFDEMQDYSPDGFQVPTAHSKYGDPAMETVLTLLHQTMEESTGLQLYPTYSFYRVYRNGDDLKIHKDRPACEISCTVCFNYSYDSKDYEWPIFMEGNAVNLKPGDLVIYKGTELDHWREPFDIHQENQWHVQGFFHYVNANGPYTEHKFDGRNSVGELTQQKTENQTQEIPRYISFV